MWQSTSKRTTYLEKVFEEVDTVKPLRSQAPAFSSLRAPDATINKQLLIKHRTQLKKYKKKGHKLIKNKGTAL